MNDLVALRQALDAQAKALDELLALGDRILEETWELPRPQKRVGDSIRGEGDTGEPEPSVVWTLLAHRDAVFQRLHEQPLPDGRTLDDPTLRSAAAENALLDLLDLVRSKVVRVLRQNAQIETRIQTRMAEVTYAVQRLQQIGKFHSASRASRPTLEPGLAVDKRG
jgi:hypothetical protein